MLLALTLLNGRFDYGPDAMPWTSSPAGFRYRQVNDRTWDSFHRFDARGYHSIAVAGYDAIGIEQRSNTAFFPGYSWLGRAAHDAVGFRDIGVLEQPDPRTMFHVLQALSSLLFVGALVLFWIWAKQAFDAETARRGALLLIVAPWTFVFDAPFSESCFLFFSIAALLCAERRLWWLAALAAAQCAITRSVGLAVFAAVVGLYIIDPDRRRRGIGAEVLAFLMPPLALIAYFLHVAEKNGDMLAYFHQQGRWFGHDEFPTLSGIVELFSPSTKDGVWDWARDALQVGVTLAALAGTVGLLRLARSRGGKAWIHFGLTAVLLAAPLLSGSLLSMPRYVSVLFPLYVVWARCLGSGRLARWVTWSSVPVLAVCWLLWIHNRPVLI